MSKYSIIIIKRLILILFFVSFFSYSQSENYLTPKDSIFIIFKEGKNQFVKSLRPLPKLMEIDYISYWYFFENEQFFNFVIDRTYDYEKKPHEILRTFKVKKSFLKKNKDSVYTIDDINKKKLYDDTAFFQYNKIFIIDLSEKKGRNYIAREVKFYFIEYSKKDHFRMNSN
ncbi:hypothetical protein [Flavobacterium filum]|uniref:hypothetical protein n=1 Tax=Flavobacterium filum TaxID=370974 RepID=UPI0004224FBE|nr:hypothetical protein [Flavobacterium filum]